MRNFCGDLQERMGESADRVGGVTRDCGAVSEGGPVGTGNRQLP